MTYVISIPGTHASRRQAEWSRKDSPFQLFLGTHNIRPFLRGGQGFYWSTDLDVRNHYDWRAAAASLFYYVTAAGDMRYRPMFGSETNMIVHSHALQVALYAAAGTWDTGVPPLQINTLVSVGSPIRKDMREVAIQARPNIKRWIHFHSDASDRWQWIGTLFDGHFGIVRQAVWRDESRVVVAADYSYGVPRAGHAGVLRDPRLFHHWEDFGVIQDIKKVWR